MVTQGHDFVAMPFSNANAFQCILHSRVVKRCSFLGGASHAATYKWVPKVLKDISIEKGVATKYWPRCAFNKWTIKVVGEAQVLETLNQIG